MDCKPDQAVLKQSLKEYIGQLSTNRFDKLCRACLFSEETVLMLISTFENISLWEVFNGCASVQTEHDDNLPKSICLSCRTALLQVHTFKQQCQRSNDILCEVISEQNSIRPIQGKDVPHDPVIEDKPIIKSAPPKQKTLTCKDCAETFTMYNKLKTHRQKFHLRVRRRIACTESSKSINCRRLKEHMITQTKEKSLSCEICQRSFLSRIKLIEHNRTHTKEKPFSCEVCKTSFSLKCNLRRHMRMHTGERPYICDICGQDFTQATSLVTHKRILHTGERPFVCSHCGLSFRYVSTYRTHLNKHNENYVNIKLHECDICKKNLNGAASLAIHKRMHTGEKPYLCNYCGKSFGQSSTYKMHLKTEHGQNGDGDNSISNYVCDVCKKSYKTKSGIRLHSLIHGEKKFLCSDCGKGFTHKTTLLSHMKVHTGEKPYSCKMCDKTFSHLGSLTGHVLIHTGTKPYVCKICSKAFTQGQQLKSHMRTHSGEKPYVCTFCNKRFAVKGNLTTHVRIHTGDTPYVCDVCNKGFYDSSSMKKHKRSHGCLEEKPIINKMVTKREK